MDPLTALWYVDQRSFSFPIELSMRIYVEANSTPNSVQQNTQVLLSAQTLHSKGLGPCTDLELQFKGHPKHLGCVTLLFWEGQEAL